MNFDYATQLKNSTIKVLLKIKRCKNSNNRELLERLEDSSHNLIELFEMRYLELFNSYYKK